MMNSDRVSLSVVHKLVATPPLNLPFILWCMRQVRVLHHLGKQETLLVVIPTSSIYRVDVGQPSESGLVITTPCCKSHEHTCFLPVTRYA